MNEVILVTGGAGSIGSNLVKNLLLDKKRKIVVIDDLTSGSRRNLIKNRNVVFIKGDVSKTSDLKRVFSYRISLVFHMAAHFANQNSIDHPEDDLLTNAMGTLKILEHALKRNVKKVVYASTSCVYGNANIPVAEDMINFKHDTPYSISKLTGEKYVTFFSKYHNLPSTILRYFNVYGPGEMPGIYRNVIPNFFYKAIKGEGLTVTGTGSETRDFTYIDDAIGATIKAANSKKADGEIINIASGTETKIIDLAIKINKLAGNQAKILFVGKRGWDNISRRSADISKARALLGYEPRTDIDEGLFRTYQWLKKKLK